jgi:hypothetical protein
MWFTRQVNGFKAWFVVTSGGSLVTGIAAIRFTVTVVNPADTLTNVPVVAESAVKLGLYTFLIPSAFITTNGVGNYAVVVQVNKPPPGAITAAFNEVLEVSQEDFDSLGQATIAVRTTAVVGSTATDIRTGLTQADNFFNDMQVVVVNAAGVAARTITDFTQVNGVIKVSALPFVPAAGNPVVIIARHAGATSPGAIASAVWDELTVGHVGVGSFGELTQDMETILRALMSLL